MNTNNTHDRCTGTILTVGLFFRRGSVWLPSEAISVPSHPHWPPLLPASAQIRDGFYSCLYIWMTSTPRSHRIISFQNTVLVQGCSGEHVQCPVNSFSTEMDIGFFVCFILLLCLRQDPHTVTQTVLELTVWPRITHGNC